MTYLFWTSASWSKVECDISTHFQSIILVRSYSFLFLKCITDKIFYCPTSTLIPQIEYLIIQLQSDTVTVSFIGNILQTSSLFLCVSREEILQHYIDFTCNMLLSLSQNIISIAYCVLNTFRLSECLTCILVSFSGGTKPPPPLTCLPPNIQVDELIIFVVKK